MLNSTLAPDDLAGLLQRHRAFWAHQDQGPPLVNAPRPGERPRFVNVDVTPDKLDVQTLTPEVGRRRGGDLLPTHCAFARIPWMEAIVGCAIRAGADEAMWPRPALGPDFEGVERIVPEPDNPWLVKLLDLTRALVEANDGSYLVTHTLQRGPIDLLSALLGDVRMGLALYDQPERIEEVLRQTARAFIEVGRAQYELLPPLAGGWSAWIFGLWAPGRVIRSQSDSASQISAEMYRDQILPHDRAIMRAFDYSVIDLHSAGTLHLHPVLLEVEELDAISVTLDGYRNAPTIEELTPTFAAILEAKSLIVAGEMKVEQLDRLTRALPSGCLCIHASITDKLLWERPV